MALEALWIDVTCVGKPHEGVAEMPLIREAVVFSVVFRHDVSIWKDDKFAHSCNVLMVNN